MGPKGDPGPAGVSDVITVRNAYTSFDDKGAYVLQRAVGPGHYELSARIILLNYLPRLIRVQCGVGSDQLTLDLPPAYDLPHSSSQVVALQAEVTLQSAAFPSVVCITYTAGDDASAANAVLTILKVG
ncbi:MAG: hypothetical protein M3083_10880 [Actinomycetota bacterium]|nr:hypothetical protein [Actinomycetota bacterium]MDQ6944839.1 hypothetical protein [Actinomycetota bacterium]